ncbi:MAG TPA: hypothetical protein VGI45_09825 [Terracidiphilus sp.]
MKTVVGLIGRPGLLPISVSLVGLMLWAASVTSAAQAFTCDNGTGEYSTVFSGVTISVGPHRSGGFAERSCAARLNWNGERLSVESEAAQVGIDVLGADLGFKRPVVAFQIDRSGGGTARIYQIYSLTKPPKLLYSLAGGDSYAAADTDLDGRIEIWTNDAAAVDGFEKIPLKDFDLAPTVVLRFEDGRLTDAGSQFRSNYDMQISSLRNELDPRDLADFKSSDGVLAWNANRPPDESHRLVRTKIKVLEIVWLYLYSGREQEAWSALADMWPSTDRDRIRLAITRARGNGILRNGISESPRKRFKQRVEIYDVVGDPAASNVIKTLAGAHTGFQAPPVIKPRSILLRGPLPAPGEELSRAGELVDLTVDAAGKVRSAQMVHGEDPKLIDATATWQFIPAFRDEQPVACHFQLRVWNLQ